MRPASGRRLRQPRGCGLLDHILIRDDGETCAGLGHAAFHIPLCEGRPQERPFHHVATSVELSLFTEELVPNRKSSSDRAAGVTDGRLLIASRFALAFDYPTPCSMVGFGDLAPRAEGENMLKHWRRAIQNIVILIVRPYVIRELPGWGKVASFLDYRWDWLWADAPVKTIREKMYGNLIQLDLSTWSDRSYYFLGRWYDLEIQLLIADLVRPGETIVDVGANRGAFALVASHLVGSRGKVICFEPNPHSVKSLEDVIELNKARNITIHQCGLADKDDVLTLTVPLINSGEGSFGSSQYKDNLMFSVPVRRGDGILANEKPSLIKIDVEGFETKVILGLSKTIERWSPIVITEVIARHLERARSSVEDLKNTMERLGYKGFKLALRKNDRRYDWGLAKLDPSKGPCDAVWLNASVAAQRMISEQKFH
jgi:FkbM family methyltransferase